MARTATKGRPSPDPDELPADQRERRDRIVNAAILLLEEREYDEIQIKDVADEAGVALATLYRYFTSKDHLYAAALLGWSDAYNDAEARPPRRSMTTDAQRLRYIVRQAIKAVGARPQLLRTEMVLANSQDPNAREVFDQFAERHVDVMRAALKDAPAQRIDGIVETTYCVLGLRLQSWARGRCTIDEVERAVNRTIDLVLAGAEP